MSIPTHVAIIMDGNRRWAKEQGKPTIEGHRYVADVLIEQLVEHAADRGIKYLTLWAWSTENWHRQPQEVKLMMQLFQHVVSKGFERLHKKGVRIQTIGVIDQFPKSIARRVMDAVEKTKNNKRITVIFALNYGGRDEIVRGVNRLVNNVILGSEANPESDSGQARMTKEMFSQYLDTKAIPDPELIIRTGGEKRLSGFLLWQSEYSELYFTDTLMPEFTPDRLDEAVEEFARRQRRFGK